VCAVLLTGLGLSDLAPLLHAQVRDVDLDTLERVAACITWGDLEAEDTRHLSEANFTKIFRLAQLLAEYLLYVQV
jgi:zinc finger protein DZIP1